LIAEMAEFPRPSLAASTPSILFVRLRQHLLEDRQRLLVVPVGHRLISDLLGLAGVIPRLEDRVIALLEQRGVVVGRRAVELGDVA
jgi:hypothetical protein